MNNFAQAAIARGNHWHCAECDQTFDVRQMDWTDVVPTCPNCFVTDMMFEEEEKEDDNE